MGFWSRITQWFEEPHNQQLRIPPAQSKPKPDPYHWTKRLHKEHDFRIKESLDPSFPYEIQDASESITGKPELQSQVVPDFRNHENRDPCSDFAPVPPWRIDKLISARANRMLSLEDAYLEYESYAEDEQAINKLLPDDEAKLVRKIKKKARTKATKRPKTPLVRPAVKGRSKRFLQLHKRGPDGIRSERA